MLVSTFYGTTDCFDVNFPVCHKEVIAQEHSKNMRYCKGVVSTLWLTQGQVQGVAQVDSYKQGAKLLHFFKESVFFITSLQLSY